MSSPGLCLIQTRRNRCVLRLYKCRSATVGWWAIKQAASEVSTSITTWPPLAHKSPSSLHRWMGKGGRGNDPALREENLTVTARMAARF